ncbi:M48 family metallopeptidase [Microvirga arabica]|uniref:M48 family metallopeptidase n=1 Tax=Microvirga arabica TaxID=1128671 RepID=A0ABV6YH37_9HYPH
MINNEQDVLREKVSYWAQQLGVEPKLVRVQHMTRKWGSCSIAGVITLATDLTSESSSFQDFVIVHELLHLRVPNHGKLFKALIGAYVPDWRRHDAYRLQRSPPKALEPATTR